MASPLCRRASCGRTNPKIVGWVEQRETHRLTSDRGILYNVAMLDLARVERVGVVERPMAASKARRGGDRALDVGVGPLDRSFDAQPLGQARSNRRGESAAGPMSMAGRGARGLPRPGARFCHAHATHPLL